MPPGSRFPNWILSQQGNREVSSCGILPQIGAESPRSRHVSIILYRCQMSLILKLGGFFAQERYA
jgi:hypothetical protein